jgi:hypothetical protein
MKIYLRKTHEVAMGNVAANPHLSPAQCMGMPQNLVSSSNIIHTWGMSTVVTKCQTVPVYVFMHGSG